MALPAWITKTRTITKKSGLNSSFEIKFYLKLKSCVSGYFEWVERYLNKILDKDFVGNLTLEVPHLNRELAIKIFCSSRLVLSKIIYLSAKKNRTFGF